MFEGGYACACVGVHVCVFVSLHDYRCSVVVMAMRLYLIILKTTVAIFRSSVCMCGEIPKLGVSP